LAAADGYLSKPFTQEQLIASVEDGSREKRS
jgi:DNA-binding response OmpR family regulator